MPDPAALVDRLAALSSLEGIPREELEWLVAHGEFEVHDAGAILAPKGKRVTKLWVILSGRIAVAVDHGAGPRRVTEWRTGAVMGMLPYSRMTGPPGDNRAESRSECLAVHEEHFREMAHRCATFTAYCVHHMLDRARTFSASELQDEKMVSLGKLAAGLAHEINNPAAATVRGAKQLLAGLTASEAASRALGAAGFSDSVLEAIEHARTACLATPADAVLSAVQQADREDEIADWLQRHDMDPTLADSLADTAVTIEALQALADQMSGDTLAAGLRWIATGCTVHSLAVEIEQAATRIAELVAAVKRFTYMDNLAGPELFDLEPGLRDTIKVVAAKARAKGAAVTVEMDDDLPFVYGTGSELNQVWLNLIDNALDAIPESGHVVVSATQELDRVVVRVTDDGPGIAADVLPHIFDPFFTTKPPGSGTGMGLEIARRLVRRYQGDIGVDSRPGRTEFCVRLAIEQPAVPAPPPPHPNRGDT
jgi:signal transduction histidine kinase